MRNAEQMRSLLRQAAEAGAGRVVTRKPDEVHQLELLADAKLVALAGTERGGAVRDPGCACTARITDRGYRLAHHLDDSEAGQSAFKEFRSAIESGRPIRAAAKGLRRRHRE